MIQREVSGLDDVEPRVFLWLLILDMSSLREHQAMSGKDQLMNEMYE